MSSRTSRFGGALDVLLAVAFLVLLVRVATQSGPLALDSRLTDALPPLHGGDSVAALSWPAQLVTDLGHPTAWTLGTLLVSAAVAVVRRSWVPVRIVVLPVGLEAGIVLLLKAALGRTGPPGSRAPDPFGYFPSGHTATALVCTGALAALVAVSRPRRARVLRVGVLVWSLLMAAALVYCRYHWVTDVLASLLLGLLVLRLCCPLWGPAARRAPSGHDPTAQDDALRLREDA